MAASAKATEDSDSCGDQRKICKPNCIVVIADQLVGTPEICNKTPIFYTLRNEISKTSLTQSAYQADVEGTDIKTRDLASCEVDHVTV